MKNVKILPSCESIIMIAAAASGLSHARSSTLLVYFEDQNSRLTTDIRMMESQESSARGPSLPRTLSSSSSSSHADTRLVPRRFLLN